MSKFLMPVAAGLVTVGFTGFGSPTNGRSAEVVAHRPSTPGRRGTLVLVGGGSMPDSVRQCFLKCAGGSQARLVIIPSASARPDVVARALAYWKTAPVRSVRILHTTRRAEADDPRFYGQLRDATGVWISGGDQSRLTALYGGTGVQRELREVLHRGGVVGGTSAGASVVSAVMVAGDAQTGTGFGLIPDSIIDQHFSNRHRLPRLLRFVHSHPGQVGIGLDEGTAVVIRDGEVTVLGRATVTVALPGTQPPAVRVYHAGSHFQQPTVQVMASR